MALRFFRFIVFVLPLVAFFSALHAATFYVDASVGASGDGTSWATAFKRIQEGIDAASDGDAVIVAEGNYPENLIFGNWDITLRGTNPTDVRVVQSTIVDGSEAGPCVTLTRAQGPETVIAGLTITNGLATHGGGIYGAGVEGEPRTSARIEYNIIAGNFASLYGGGIFGCDGLIQHNIISLNQARYGGGLSYCDGIVRENRIAENSASNYGGGLQDCDGVVEGNLIESNSADWRGGGLDSCDGVIRQNTISLNTSSDGGGLGYCDAAIDMNMITENRAIDGAGGGVLQCNGRIQDNHIQFNQSRWGGGLSSCDGNICENYIVSNSANNNGGGLYNCNGLIEKNIILSNTGEWSGGGLITCEGVIRGNTISRNQARSGGGLANCDGLIDSNSIEENEAVEEAGGGLWGCDGMILGNTIAGNIATSFGGGLSTCNATIGGNRVYANFSVTSGGGLAFCDGGLIQSNVICANWSGVAGGGIFDCDAPIINNTVVANSSGRGGGLSLCDGLIANSIVWDNSAISSDPQFDRCSDPSYCCIQDWTGGGENNIAFNPLFIDADGPDGDPGTCEDNDYRLTSGVVFISPCIDAGDNSVLNPPGLDADGNLRIARGKQDSKYPVVDMGAYERGSRPFSIVEIADNSSDDVTLTWNSQVNDTYIVLACKDLLSSSWTEEATVPSEGSQTTWTDPAPSTSMKSYRVQMALE
jgi:hypothetical protein